MQIHPRESNVREAEFDLRKAIGAVCKKHELTDMEALRAVNEALSSFIAGIAKYGIREERHPENPGKPGGLL